MGQATDQPLIKLTLAGDVKAFAQLVSKYQHMVYTLALKLVGNTAEAEEVAQDAFLQAFKALPAFKGDSKFSTWLYKIVYHKGLDALKKRKRKLEVLSIDAYPNLDIVSLENNWGTLEGREQKRVIKKAIEALSSDDAILITLFYFEELSLNEIADIMSLETNTVKVKLFRARNRLADILRKNWNLKLLKVMKGNKQKELDTFLKKAIENLELEEVSPDFAKTLLAKIERSKQQSETTVYRPLIAKYVWWMIGIVFAGSFVLMGLKGNIGDGWFSTLKWNTIGNTDLFETLPNLALSDSGFYGVLGLTFFLLVQIVYLKRFFSKRQVII